MLNVLIPRDSDPGALDLRLDDGLWPLLHEEAPVLKYLSQLDMLAEKKYSCSFVDLDTSQSLYVVELSLSTEESLRVFGKVRTLVFGAFYSSTVGQRVVHYVHPF